MLPWSLFSIWVSVIWPLQLGRVCWKHSISLIVPGLDHHKGSKPGGQKSCREGATSIVRISLCHMTEPPEIPSEPLVREGNKSSHIHIDTSGPHVTFSWCDPSWRSWQSHGSKGFSLLHLTKAVPPKHTFKWICSENPDVTVTASSPWNSFPVVLTLVFTLDLKWSLLLFYFWRLLKFNLFTRKFPNTL